MPERRQDILDREDEIRQWIKESKSKAFISRELKCKPETLDRYLKLMNIEYKGNQGLKGKTTGKYKTAEEYIQGERVQSSRLRVKLLRDGIKTACCEKCGLSEWLGQPIPLELHHKDGNHFNNALENLVMLCPNCHSLEPNDSGRSSTKK